MTATEQPPMLPESDPRPRAESSAPRTGRNWGAWSVLGEAAAAAVVAAVVAVVGLKAFSVVHWPAFDSSNQTRALTTVGQVCCLVALGVSIALTRLRTPSRRQRWAAKLLSWAGLSGFVTVTLGMPLAATKLYLGGISVDQEFRTEYLTRLTDSPALHDMTYSGLPAYYPAGWFWIGGRLAALLGVPGWEIFKPYAITVIAVAAVAALVLWSKLVRPDLAVPAALATTAVVLAYAAPEPYGAPVALLLVPALILAWGGLHRPGASGRWGWGAVAGTGLFLGGAACFYTLYFAIAAATVALMGAVAAGLAWRAHGSWRAALPVARRLAATAAVAGALSMVVWTPYLLALPSHPTAGSGTAFHYLPESGSTLAMPMFRLSLLGGLCLIGTLWLLLRAHASRRAQALGLGVAAVYIWSLASMSFTVLGTTLLSFRLEPILAALLSAAGVFGFVEGAGAIWSGINRPPGFRTAALALGAAGAVAFCQALPHIMAGPITTAYTDTDGDGVRADQRPPSAVSHYHEIDRDIAAQLPGLLRRDVVVLTGDTTFLAYYPYAGFQAATSHYANPMAEYKARDAAIQEWAGRKSPAELLAALDSCRWTAPAVFLFRESGDDYTLRLAEDVYPNDPNVKRYTVAFPKKLFADPAFHADRVGPFTVITRHQGE
ncbi:MAG: arabinofuranosyltransferase [Mycobacteriaceae bacterium]|nr:arabinofuranosyltransferase [Mycobacteriaceae bacterium]